MATDFEAQRKVLNKLADLIEEGIKIVPQQAFGAFFRNPVTGAQSFAACVTSTAYCGAVKSANVATCTEMDNRLNEELGIKLSRIWVKYPGDRLLSGKLLISNKGRVLPLDSVLVNLNDEDKWSRESIAQWLRHEAEIVPASEYDLFAGLHDGKD